MDISVIALVLLMVPGSPAHSPHVSPVDKAHVEQPNSTALIAFAAELSSSKTFADETTVEFDNEIVNVGGLYFPNNGQFVCPDSGLYVFMWSISKPSVAEVEGMRCITKLRIGGTEQKYGPKTSYNSFIGTSWSGYTEMMSVLQCSLSPPTAITIRAAPWSQTIPATTYNGRSAFLGFRLHTGIAFTAEVSTDRYIFDGGKMIFDSVLSNYGGHYDHVHGYFRCPDNGIYVFSVSTQTTDPSTPWSVSRLMKEEEVVVHGPITYIATEAYDSGSSSTTTVLQCTTGHSIYVEAQAAHHFLYNSYAPQLTAFTGFKLSDMTEAAIAFTAVMTANHTTTTERQTFMFDKMITNIGNTFNPITSTFLCPGDSYYLFTWTITLNYGGGLSDVALYMDDTYIKRNRCTIQYEDDDTGTSGSCTTSTIRQCAPGSVFQLKGMDVQERVYLGEYTTFSGCKIPGDLSTQ